jgi:hypothetical protein
MAKRLIDILPKVIRSGLQYYDKIKSSGYTSKGDKTLQELAQNYQYSLLTERAKKDDTSRLLAIPVSQLPEIPGGAYQYIEKLKKELKSSNPNDVLVIVEEPATQLDGVRNGGTIVHGVLMSPSNADLLIKQVQTKPEILDSFIQAQNNGPVEQYDGTPANITAKKVTIVPNTQYGGQVEQEQTIEFSQDYKINSPVVFQQLEEEFIDEIVEEPLQQLPPELTEVPEAQHIEQTASVDTVGNQILQRQMNEAAAEKASRDARLAEMRTSHQRSADQATALREQREAAQKAQQTQVPQQTPQQIPVQTPVAEPILASVGEAVQSGIQGAQQFAAELKTDLQELQQQQAERSRQSTSTPPSTQRPQPNLSQGGQPPIPPGGQPPQRNTPTPNVVLNANQIQKAAENALENANNYSARTSPSSTEYADPTLQRLVRQAVSETTREYGNLTLQTDPQVFERNFQKKVLEKVEQKIQKDKSLANQYTTEEFRDAQTILPTKTKLSQNLENIALVMTGAATGEYLRQQSANNISTPTQQTQAAFPNVPTEAPTYAPTPEQQFGQAQAIVDKTAQELTNQIIQSIPAKELVGNQRSALTKALNEEYKQLLGQNTSAFDIQTSTDDLRTALREKTNEVIALTTKVDTKNEDLQKRTNKAVAAAVLGGTESKGLIDSLRTQRDVVFESMRSQAQLGVLQDQTGNLFQHLEERKKLQDRIDSLESFKSAQTSGVRARDVEALKTQLDAIDDKFIKDNKPTINSYVASVSPSQTLTQQTSRFSEQALNMTGFTNLITQAQSGNVPLSTETVAQALQKSSDQTVDRSISTFAQQLAQEVQAKQTSPQQAEEKFSQYLKSQREIAAAFQGESQQVNTTSKNFFTRAENLERSIIKGTDEVTNAFLAASQSKIGELRYAQKGLKPSDEDQALAEVMGWKEYEKLLSSGKKINVHEELVKRLGEGTKQGELARLNYLGYEVGTSSINPTFYKELSSEIIRIGAENPNAQPGDFIKIYRELSDKYVNNAPNAKIYQLTDDEISQISQKLLSSKNVQQALAAAKMAGFVLPSLSELSDDDLKHALERTLTGTSTRKYEESGLKVSYEQVFRDSIREDYVDSLADLLVKSKGLDKDRAKALAQDAVFATLGGITLIDNGKGYVTETMGVLPNTQIQDFGYYHRLAIENMSPEERTKYLKQFPKFDAIYQRDKTIKDELLNYLKLNGITIDEKLLQQLVETTRREELHAEMAGAEKKLPPLMKLGAHSEINELQAKFRNDTLQRAIHGQFQGFTNYLTSFVPIKSTDKKALILGQLFHPDKGSRDVEKEISSFLIRNKLLDANGSYSEYLYKIMKGEVPKEFEGKLGTRHRNTLSALADKSRFMNDIAKIQAAHPEWTAILSKWGKFLERDDVQFTRMVFSGNPIQNTFNFTLNYVYNQYKLGTGKYQYYPETGRIENIERYERKFQKERDKEFKRKLRIFNAKKSVKTRYNKFIQSEGFKKFLDSGVGKFLTKVKDRVVNFAKKVFEKVTKFFIGLIPVVGQLYTFLDKITLGFFSKFLNKLLKIIAGILAVWILNFLLGLLAIPSAIIGFFQGAFSGAAKGIGQLQAGLRGFQFGTGGGQLSLGMINPYGMIQSIGSFASSAGSFLATTGSAFSGMMTWVAKLGVLGPVPLLVATVATFYGVTQDNLEQIAFMNGPDALSEISTAADFNKAKNPLKLTKTGPNKVEEDGAILYRINLESPACAKTITVTDVVPTNSAFDPSFPLTFNPPNPQDPGSVIDNMTAVYDPTTRIITWTITLKDGQFQGPCTITSGIGSANLRDVNAATTEEINRFLNGHNMEGTGELFIKYARETQVNPLLVAAILGYESGWGDTGIGTPPRPDGGGCYNPGGARNWPTGAGAPEGDRTCQSAKYGLFWRFPGYESAIKATFHIVSNIIDREGATTVEQLSNSYIPVDESTANYVNCPRDGVRFAPYPNREPDDQTSCIKGLNAFWKWRVSCIMSRKENCSFNLDEYRQYKLNSGIISPGLTNKVVADLQFQVKPTANDVCITNTAYAKEGDEPNVLQNTAQFSTAVGNKQCSFGLEIAQAANTIVGLDGEGPLIRCNDIVNGQKNGGPPYTNVCYEGEIFYNHHLLFDGVPAGEEHLYKGPGAGGAEWFWCTYTPIKAYQAVGKNGLNGILSAQGQKDYFATRNGYSVVRDKIGDQPLALPQSLKPGDVIMYFTDSAPDIDHVGIVYSVNLDANGDGNIELRESNAEVKSRRIFVENNVPQGPSKGLQVAGFGNQDVVE